MGRHGHRRYTLGKRAEKRDETRARIVAATMECHLENGILATTVRDVAARAGVSPGTVLNHFPRLEQLVQACGELTSATYAFPAASVVDASAPVAERVHALTSALFRHWDTPLGAAWDHLQLERAALPALDAFFREREAIHRALVAAALPPSSPRASRALAYALTALPTWRTLTSEGLSTGEAAAQAASAVIASLGRDAARGASAREEQATCRPGSTKSPSAPTASPRSSPGSARAASGSTST
jgi:AcrR family transcriptional regulator